MLRIYSTIKSLVNSLKNHNVSGFHNINLIQTKLQPPNLKKLLTNAEYGDVSSGMFNCSEERCGSCNYLLINDHYTFKNFQITFELKNTLATHLATAISTIKKVKGHLTTCGNSELQIFTLLHIRSQDTDLRGSHETRFQQKLKTKLSKLKSEAYARKVHKKPSIVKQLFIVCITLKTDVSNLQSS